MFHRVLCLVALLMPMSVFAADTSVLTKHEGSCQAIGVMAGIIADARDRGALLTDTLTALRRAHARHSELPAWTQRLNDAIAYDLYGDAAVMPPAQARRLLETVCLTKGHDAVMALYGLDPPQRSSKKAAR